MTGDRSERGGATVSEQALFDYFDDLLGTGPTPAPAEPPVRPRQPEPVRQPLATEVTARPFAEPVRTLNLRPPLPPLAEEAARKALSKPVVETETPPPVSEVIEPPVVVAVEAAPAPEPEPPVVVAEPVLELERAPAPWLENGRPQWAQQSFEGLLFRVGGLALAVPLVELGSIYKLAEQELTPIFGQADWFMGILAYKDRRVRVVDTARVVMPERYDATMRDGYRYVITLNGSDWGLAVDKVVSSIRLSPDEVRWRGQRSQRPWLAGTVVAQMCALLDGAQLIWLFDNQDRKRRGKNRE